MGDVDDVASVESDDVVADQEQFIGSRRAVSSGEPSLDGSVDDDEREALSDSDLGAVARTSTIASQVKGPSSDALEGACFAEAKARLTVPHCEDHKKEETPVDDEEWDDILGSGQLMKKITCASSVEKRPKDGYWVTANVTSLKHASDSRDRFTFILGFGMVIDAWELIIKLMNVGEKCLVKASPRFAYGSVGLPPDIPSDESQEYELELLEIGTSPKFSIMPPEELEEFLAMLRERGKFYFKREEFDKAVFVYRRATSLVDIPDGTAEDEILLKKNISMFHSNMAVCYDRMNDIDGALSATSEALKLDPENVKALYRRAKILSRKNLTEEAIDYVQRALKIEPNDQVMIAELQCLREIRKRQKEQERARCRRMLTGAGTVENKARGRVANLLQSFRSRRSQILVAFFVVTLALFVHFLIQASHS